MKNHSEASRRLQLSLGSSEHPVHLSLGIKNNALQVSFNTDNEKKARGMQKWIPPPGRASRTLNHPSNHVVFHVPQDKVNFSLNDTPATIASSFRKGLQPTLLQETTYHDNKKSAFNSQWREDESHLRRRSVEVGEKTFTNDDTDAIAKNFADFKREIENMKKSIRELKEVAANRESTRLVTEFRESSKYFIRLQKQLERVKSIENLLEGIKDPLGKPSKHIYKVKAIESKLEDLKKPLEESLSAEKERLSRTGRSECGSVQKLMRKLTKSMWESKVLIDSIHDQDQNLASISKNYIRHVQVLCENQQKLLRKLSKTIADANKTISDDENRVKSNDGNSRVQSKSGSSHDGIDHSSEIESEHQLIECKRNNGISDKSIALKEGMAETKSELSKLEEKLGRVKSSYEDIKSQRKINSYKTFPGMEGNSPRTQEVYESGTIGPPLRTSTPKKKIRDQIEISSNKLPSEFELPHAENGSTNDYIYETVIKQILRCPPGKFLHSKSDVMPSISQTLKQVDRTVENILPSLEIKSSGINYRNGKDDLSKQSIIEKRTAPKNQENDVTEGDTDEREVGPEDKIYFKEKEESNEYSTKNLHKNVLNKSATDHRDISPKSSAGNEGRDYPLAPKSRKNEESKFVNSRNVSKGNRMFTKTSLFDNKDAEHKQPRSAGNATSMQGHDSLNLGNDSAENVAQVKEASDCPGICNKPGHSDFINVESPGTDGRPTNRNVVEVKKHGDPSRRANKEAVPAIVREFALIPTTKNMAKKNKCPQRFKIAKSSQVPMHQGSMKEENQGRKSTKNSTVLREKYL